MLLLLAALAAPLVARPVAAADETARLARLFLASVIGRETEERRRRALQVLAETDRNLTQTPDDVALLMLKAAALGTAARATGFADSVTARYGSRSAAVIQRLKALAPDHPWTLVLSGLWHFEVVRRGGAIAGSMLGASIRQGEADLDRALALIGREDPAVSFAYAVVLASRDAGAHIDRIDRLISVSMLVARDQLDVDPVASSIMPILANIENLLDDNKISEISSLVLDIF
jgi:hypothetical protein